ncbi:MAG: hypothetical protein BWY35_02007 [Firmicutes bacterium ADurb.Bin248]|nr:MAG: hypothetical protein BWY35_02007 [Firmicutes bacterium ADurb.Bin248]
MYYRNLQEDKVVIECNNCEKVYKFQKKYFSIVSDNYCINNTMLQCPNCKNTVYPNTKIEAKKDTSMIRCPYCGSTQIQMVARKWSPLTGFFTNKVDRVCVKCKKKF